MPQAMYKREKKVHLITSAVKIGYKHLWNSKKNFWMLKHTLSCTSAPSIHLRLARTRKKRPITSLFGRLSYSGRCPLFRQEIRLRVGMESICRLSPYKLKKRRKRQLVQPEEG